MTLEECREYLPEGWAAAIQQDPVLLDIFDGHAYELEQEAVPPFLIQSLRGGELERLRPILSRYGQPGLALLQGLLQIDAASRDTAVIQLPDGQTAHAGYFFARFSEADKQAAADAARAYIRAVNRVYTEEFEEPAPLGADADIVFLSGKEGRGFQEQMHRDFCLNTFHPGDAIYGDLGDWCRGLGYRQGCADLALLDEALYHINCDYFLSFYLQWPAFQTARENPFASYFALWKMGLHVYFPERNRVVLVG